MAFKQHSPKPLIEGGTQLSSTVPYAVLTGGTTGTGPLQQVAGVGSAGQVLVTGGSSALPSWQSVAAGGSWVLIQTQNLTNAINTTFNTGINTTYINYAFLLQGICANGWGVAGTFMALSTDGGSTFPPAFYNSGVAISPYAGGVPPATWNATYYSSPLNFISSNLLSPGGLSFVMFIHGIGNNMQVGWTGQCFYGGVSEFFGTFSPPSAITNAFRVTTSGVFTGSMSLYGIIQ